MKNELIPFVGELAQEVAFGKGASSQLQHRKEVHSTSTASQLQQHINK
jgi:hypothetical protein